jgi:hypothetical protein
LRSAKKANFGVSARTLDVLELLASIAEGTRTAAAVNVGDAFSGL